MGGRRSELSVRDSAIAGTAPGRTRIAGGTVRRTVAGEARWPKAQVVMSGQLSLQQWVCGLPDPSCFIAIEAWQGISAMPAIACGWLGEMLTRGAAATAKPCARSTSPSSKLSNVRQRFMTVTTLGGSKGFSNAGPREALCLVVFAPKLSIRV